jgi:hypothetical protein
MAKWIREAQAAELAEDSSDKDDEPAVNDHSTQVVKWKQTTLVVLFGSQKQPPSQLVPVEIDAKSALMEALAEAQDECNQMMGRLRFPQMKSTMVDLFVPNTLSCHPRAGQPKYRILLFNPLKFALKNH